jgi:hypothetical protein
LTALIAREIKIRMSVANGLLVVVAINNGDTMKKNV